MKVEQLVIASRSVGKLRELRELFERAGWPIIDLEQAGIAPSPTEDDLESGETFEENALAKARYFASISGSAVVADDSGLQVGALDGRPGVQSKRWSARPGLSGQLLDDANNARLLAELDGATDRSARYVCVAAFVRDAIEILARGTTEGRILERPRGRGGFGYDPYFFSNDLGKTFAEASVAEKEAVSHRGRAFRLLLAELSRR